MAAAAVAAAAAAKRKELEDEQRRQSEGMESMLKEFNAPLALSTDGDAKTSRSDHLRDSRPVAACLRSDLVFQNVRNLEAGSSSSGLPSPLASSSSLHAQSDTLSLGLPSPVPSPRPFNAEIVERIPSDQEVDVGGCLSRLF